MVVKTDSKSSTKAKTKAKQIATASTTKSPRSATSRKTKITTEVQALASAVTTTNGSSKPSQVRLKKKTLPAISDGDVSYRAYMIWEREGRPQGCEQRHWKQAIEELQRERKS